MSWSLFALIAGISTYVVLLREIRQKPFGVFVESWTMFVLLAGSISAIAISPVMLLLPWMRSLSEDTREWLPLVVVLPLVIGAYSLIFLSIHVRDKARRRQRETLRP